MHMKTEIRVRNLKSGDWKSLARRDWKNEQRRHGTTAGRVFEETRQNRSEQRILLEVPVSTGIFFHHEPGLGAVFLGFFVPLLVANIYKSH